MEDHVLNIRKSLVMAQSQQKSYADRRCRDLEFAIGDHVYLKVSPLKGVRRFQVRGKLAPQYVGPFQIISRHGEVEYQLDLPPSLSTMHNIFHLSQLKKCLQVPTEVVDVAPQELQPDLTYCDM